MTHGIIEDSPRRCPYEGKKMLQEIGQNDDTGRCEVRHYCLSCGYFEMDTQWRDKTVHDVSSRPSVLGESLYRMRRGA
jgi:hypothetical protein